MPIIDLTLPYSDAVAGFSKRVAKTLDRDGWNASTLEIYSHAGTHMDAPVHFGVSKETIDQLPLEKCQSRAWLVDLSNIGPATSIQVSDLGEGLPTHFQVGESLLLRTDWSKRLGTAAYRDQLPRISEELAVWCVEKGVRMLGVEPPSVADVNNLEEVTRIHQILLGGGVTIVEGLANLDKITQQKVDFWAIPLKIQTGDGAPCRAMAFQNNTR